jgi:hypothetical protein
VTDSENDQPHYELIMPFVLAKSNGGPYDDDAFQAGWDLGALDVEMKIMKTLESVPTPRYWPRAWLPQVELLCMKHGLIAIQGPLDPVDDPLNEWVGLEFAIEVKAVDF